MKIKKIPINISNICIIINKNFDIGPLGEKLTILTDSMFNITSTRFICNLMII
jgi:hypothetical protein